jgi:enamine deaminase RidA (YjgF/YER057c/UK114 family)
MRSFDPPGVKRPVGTYSHGVAAGGELLFISGQTPERPDGTLPTDPEEQFRQIWANVEAVLRSAGAELGDLVHVRTYLADRRYAEANSDVRRQVLGNRTPALTVIICELFESAWVGEIEAIASLTAADQPPREGRRFDPG